MRGFEGARLQRRIDRLERAVDFLLRAQMAGPRELRDTGAMPLDEHALRKYVTHIYDHGDEPEDATRVRRLEG